MPTNKADLIVVVLQSVAAFGGFIYLGRLITKIICAHRNEILDKDKVIFTQLEAIRTYERTAEVMKKIADQQSEYIDRLQVINPTMNTDVWSAENDFVYQKYCRERSEKNPNQVRGYFGARGHY